MSVPKEFDRWAEALAAGVRSVEDILAMLATRGDVDPSVREQVQACAHVVGAGAPDHRAMVVHHIVQGSQAWVEYRRGNWNASDAPSALDINPYCTRKELLDWFRTGKNPGDDGRYDFIRRNGHRAEHLARPLAEAIVGEALYPCVGTPVRGNTRLSASFDGITLLGKTAFEHKSLNDDLRAAFKAGGASMDGSMLPERYQVQMEQQVMVSGADQVLFMATRWSDQGELLEEVHCWYTPDPKVRAKMLRGWELVAQDLRLPAVATALADTSATPEPVALPTLPALRVEAKGVVTASNAEEFKAAAMEVLGTINRALVTDEDFVQADAMVKWCKTAEEKLQAAKADVLAEMKSVNDACAMLDDVAAEARKVRLELTKLVKQEKEARKQAIITTGVEALRQHYANVNASLGRAALTFHEDAGVLLAAAIKGRSARKSIEDGVDAEVTRIKLAASEAADLIHQNIAVLRDYRAHADLFPDWVDLVQCKARDALVTLAQERIAKAKERRQVTPAATPSPKPVQKPVVNGIGIGQLNASIAPLSVTAAGLVGLGFVASKDGRYAPESLPAIYEALAGVIANAAQPLRKAA